jgi:uncharacterized membrane protein
MTLTDEKMEQIVANLLRSGVLISAAVISAGGIGYLVQHGHELAAYGTFQGEPPAFRSAAGIVQAALHWDWRAVIQFGLLLLIATPVVRVAFSIAAFALERDRTYVIITTIVFAILLYGLIGKP